MVAAPPAAKPAPEPKKEPEVAAPSVVRDPAPQEIASTVAAAAEPKPETPAAAPTPAPTGPEEKSVPAAGPVVQPVVVIERFEPTYSRKDLKGVSVDEIVLRVQVDEHGQIARVLVEQGVPGSPLEAAAVSAVLRWRFRPATTDGEPTKSWTTVRFPIEP